MCASSSCASPVSSRSQYLRCFVEGALARTLELAAQAKLQLARGFFRERHRHESSQLAASGLDDLNDASDERRRLAGSGGGLDDEGLVEGVANRVPRELVGERGASCEIPQPVERRQSRIGLFAFGVDLHPRPAHGEVVAEAAAELRQR